MIFNLIGLHGSECTEPDMQRHIAYLNAHVRYLRQQFLCKMQTSRRCGSTAEFLRVNGLIAFGVLQLLLDIRRKRHFAQAFENFEEYTLVAELDYPISAQRHFLNYCCQLAVSEYKLLPWFGFPTRTAQALPAVIAEILEQNKLNCAASRPCTDESCRQHSRIIEHKAVALVEVLLDIIKMLMLYLASLLI